MADVGMRSGGAAPFSGIPAYAATGHTYYSQNGWEYSGKKLIDMCYATCIAMSLSDLGKPVTPLDIYVNNGYTPNCKANSETAKDYGVSWNLVISGDTYPKWSADEKEAKIVKLLGNNPQGILVYGGGHMMLARELVNGIVYFDDPVNGCCLPIEQCCQTTYNNISLMRIKG